VLLLGICCANGWKAGRAIKRGYTQTESAVNR
jgi:hypothetical protein